MLALDQWPRSAPCTVCQNCGAKRAKWEGRCSDCGEWNTFVEEKPAPERTAWVNSKAGRGPREPRTSTFYNWIDTPNLDSGQRISSGIGESTGSWAAAS